MDTDADQLYQHIAAALSIELGRNPTPEEFAAALALRRKAVAEYESPSAERIDVALEKNKPNDAAPAGSRPPFDDCKAPALWTEPKRTKPTPTTVRQINEANRAKWADPEVQVDDVIRQFMAAAQGRIGQERASAKVSIGNAVSDFQSSHAQKRRPKRLPTQKSESIAAMIPWRADNHTLAEFLAAAEVGSMVGVIIKLDRNKYVVDCEDANDDPKPVSYRTLERWWGEAS